MRTRTTRYQKLGIVLLLLSVFWIMLPKFGPYTRARRVLDHGSTFGLIAGVLLLIPFRRF